MRHAQGRIVEASSTDQVFDNPREEYAKGVLAAILGTGIALGV